MNQRISVDLGQVTQIAAACRGSSATMRTEANKMRTQIANMHQALQGFPRLAMADHFEELTRLLTQVSDAMTQSDAYLKDVVAKVENFINSMGQG